MVLDQEVLSGSRADQSSGGQQDTISRHRAEGPVGNAGTRLPRWGLPPTHTPRRSSSEASSLRTTNSPAQGCRHWRCCPPLVASSLKVQHCLPGCHGSLRLGEGRAPSSSSGVAKLLMVLEPGEPAFLLFIRWSKGLVGGHPAFRVLSGPRPMSWWRCSRIGQHGREVQPNSHILMRLGNIRAARVTVDTENSSIDFTLRAAQGSPPPVIYSCSKSRLEQSLSCSQ